MAMSEQDLELYAIDSRKSCGLGDTLTDREIELIMDALALVNPKWGSRLVETRTPRYLAGAALLREGTAKLIA